MCNIVQRAFPDCSLRGAAETLADFRARCLASPGITTIRPSGFHNCHGLRLLFWRKYPHPAMPDRCVFLHFNHSPTCHHSVFFRDILIITKNHLDILLVVSKMPQDSENIIKYQHPSLHTPYHSQVIQWMTALLPSWRGQALGCLAWKKAEFPGWKTPDERYERLKYLKGIRKKRCSDIIKHHPISSHHWSFLLCQLNFDPCHIPTRDIAKDKMLCML